jgi:hypothetical protein
VGKGLGVDKAYLVSPALDLTETDLPSILSVL